MCICPPGAREMALLGDIILLQNNMQPGQSEGNNERVPWPSPLGLPREARGVYAVNGVLDEVLQEVPRPTASKGLIDERGGEQVLDAEVQVVLPTLRETEANILIKALLDGHCKPKQRTTQHNLELEVCKDARMINCWVMSMFQPRLNASRDFLIPTYSITLSMSCIWGEVGGLLNRDVQPFLIGDKNNMKKRWLRAPTQFPTVAHWWTSWKKHASARNSGTLLVVSRFCKNCTI